jgi:glutathione peroxidase
MAQSVYDIPVRRIDGRETSLGEHKGEVLLVVNVASKCGLTPQYEGLVKLHREKAPEGFSVLGFPANEFGAQEPGTNEEIQTFCSTTYGVDFPMFEKIAVKGEKIHPLYKAMIAQKPHATMKEKGELRGKLEQHGLGPKNDTDVMWNFEKFLVDRRGQVVGRFAPDIAPDDPILTTAIESALARA